MTNAASALLKNEGDTAYRDCKVTYYTYTMFERPNFYKVGVSVHIQSPQGIWIKTLPLDQEFNDEKSAINFGIDEAKKNIDKYYSLGKIPVIKPLAANAKAKD